MMRQHDIIQVFLYVKLIYVFVGFYFNLTYFFLGIAEQKPGQEIVNALQTAFIEGLIKYFETNRKWPENIVVFRDGGKKHKF